MNHSLCFLWYHTYMKIVDLSVPLNENTPVYPGDPATKIAPAGVLEKDGYQDHYVSIGTHVGTHIDAPAHMVASGKTLDQIPAERFVGRGVYIKVENNTFDLDAIKKVDIQQGDIVVFHTGLSDVYHDAKYFEDYPSVPEELAHYLVEKKISMVGLDTCSPDHDVFNAHKILLGGDVLIIENLTNLEQLAGQEFEVYALPVKLEVDGAPARVIAKI